MLNAMKSRSNTLLFWGLMDIIAIGMYICFALLRDNIPFFSDIVNFCRLLATNGVSEGAGIMGIFIFGAGLLMQVSLIWSAYMFLFQEKVNFALCDIQQLLRFATLTCSLSVYPLLLTLTDSHDLSLALVGFLYSECCKIRSLWQYRKRLAG